VTNFLKLLKAVAVWTYWYYVVYYDETPSQSATNKRKWRLAKDQVFNAFNTFWGEKGELDEGRGIPWRRIIDEQSIAYGQFARDTGKFSVERLNPSQLEFFSTMTYLLLAAAWTEA
jgi:hypothetical protein